MQPHHFVETNLPTKFGDFRFRVYAEQTGKETVVILTKKLDPNQPVLVRIHSECMTGDTFGSLRCDCGEQFAQALKMIQADGNGALIYLRQEGRGIGLFEKIRSYQLQEKGYDTFEANLLLGHRPDARTYEMAKQALDDLGVGRIKLLTNNPSKVSEIAKYGVDVVDRIPLVIAANKHNQQYFAAKRDKFKHFFHTDVSYYFYQFHAETPEHVEQIGEFLKDKKHDPLLKICVGVAADHSTLGLDDEIQRIETVFRACEFYEGFVPILHFSFRNSPDVLKDLRAIKKKLPFVKYLQTNDLKAPELDAIMLACRLFLADIPLSDENFELINDKRFRNAIKKYKAFILLDNSKGQGIRASKESLMKKIDALLEHGLNDLAIFGGFGPDDLDSYFELRRHYRINFSIDAETKLKSGTGFDFEKAKLYLNQLLRFDDPKEAGIEQTRTFLQQSRREDWNTVTIDGHEFMVHPAVFNPGSFPSTAWFADVVRTQTIGVADFCEIGCGAGAISSLVALANPQARIVATDINPFASENTKANAERLGIGDRVDVTDGDVLDGVDPNRRFDFIFWALPFGFLDPGVNVSLEERQVFDPGYRSTRKFFTDAKRYLKPGGKLLIGFSMDLGHWELMEDMAKEAGLHLRTIAEKEMQEKETVRFEVIEGIYK